MHKRIILTIIFTLASCITVNARELIKLSSQDIALDVSRAVEIYQTPEDVLSNVPTPPGSDGTARREDVQAVKIHAKGQPYNWAVFYIANTTSEPIERLLVTPHYRLIGSKIIKPDLGATRIVKITPSEGLALERKKSYDSDIFYLKIKPGSIITYVAELTSNKLPPIYLWQIDAYKNTQNSFTFYQGILLGIAVLLALFLSMLFFVRGTFVFPAIAMFAWASVAYIGLDFHFLNKIIAISTSSEPIWRAAIEVSLSASLIIFLLAYLNVYSWHYKLIYAITLIIACLTGLFVFSITHPVFIATIARIIIGITTFIGTILIGYLIYKKFNRAILIVPTWLLLILWSIAMYTCTMGYIDNDIIEPALSGGLVLLVLLISFTILQDVFATSTFHQGIFSYAESSALAVQASGDIIWDWDVQRNNLHIQPNLENFLGANAKKITGCLQNFISALHINDRNLFTAYIDLMMEKKRGKIDQIFRIRSSDNNYHWFNLRARAVVDKDGDLTNCIGILSNINEFKKVQEQFLKDTTYDNLTRLPNRNLFIDRLQNLINLSHIYKNINPVVIIIDFDNFRSVNQNHGYNIGNQFLLIMAKRFSRIIKPEDTLTHLKADRFAAILMSPTNSKEIAETIDLLKKTAKSPLTMGEKSIKLNCSIGIYNLRHQNYNAKEILANTELAMTSAKRHGGNTIELFEPNLKSLSSSLNSLSEDLPLAIERGELRVIYHPILSFADSELIGFESYTIWQHPQYGEISIPDFISCAETTGLSKLVGQFTFKTIAKDMLILQEKFAKENYFISINLNSCDLLHQDFIDDIKSILLRYPIDTSNLIFEISEPVLSEKPEQSAALLDGFKDLGFKLGIDHFSAVGSSISYLAYYPFSFVKFDKILMHEHNNQAIILLKSTIDIAHSLGYKTIAVGVDTQEEASFLADLGCDYVQSLIFTEPLNINELIKWIEKRN